MIKVFVDFDGTITTLDVGDTMFVTFGGRRCLEFIEEYRSERISAVDCFRRECDACGDVDTTDLDAFLDRQEVDLMFGDFLTFCRERGIDCCVVSDGLDYYIRRILDRCGFDVPFFANMLEFVPVEGANRVRFKPSFPYTDEVCERCACCKRNRMLTLCADDDIIVYVGEGYSDRCPARYADVVFAKDELVTYCRQENISYYEYRSFADVVQRLRTLLDTNHSGKHKLRKRRQAQLARCEVFLGG